MVDNKYYCEKCDLGCNIISRWESHIKREKHLTGQRKKRIANFPMQKIKSIISKEDAGEIRQLLKTFFENKILDKIKDCPRPIVQKYGDFVERNLGRFEITPTPLLKKQIWPKVLAY